jgi:hypothetical protein
MTSLEAYKKMLDESGIDYEETEREVIVRQAEIVGGEMVEREGDIPILMGAKVVPAQTTMRTDIKVEGGYSGFFSVHTFDANGKLVDVTAWE